MAGTTTSIPPAAGQLEPVTAEARLTPNGDVFTDNVALEVGLEGPHAGGRHVFNQSAMVVMTPPGFVSVA